MSAEAALAQLSSLPEGMDLIVDFDETLFLRNSTHEFVTMARPYLLGALLFKLLEKLHPWTWFASGDAAEQTRDWFHLIAVTVFFPWTWLVWRQKVQEMAEAWTNQPLATALRDLPSGRRILSTRGFRPVVMPILEAMGLDFAHVQCCSLIRGYRDRQQSKEKTLRDIMGEDALSRAAVITDSLSDRGLLQATAMPMLVQWEPAPIQSVTSRYIPFYYLIRLKHRSFASVFRDIFVDDFLLLLIMFTWVSPMPVWHCLGLLLFFLAFWLVYEMGYMENDQVAARFERDPVLSGDFEELRGKICHVEPWFWAYGLSVGGAVVMEWIQLAQKRVGDGGGTGPSAFLSEAGQLLLSSETYVFAFGWICVLAVMRGLYSVYNYIDKMSRTWVYPFLQGFKSVGFIFVSATTMVGLLAGFTQAASRSVGYFLYRWGRGDWPGSEKRLVNMLLFPLLLLLVGYGVSGNPLALLNWQAGAVLLLVLARGIRPLLYVLGQIRHVSQDQYTSLKD